MINEVRSRYRANFTCVSVRNVLFPPHAQKRIRNCLVCSLPQLRSIKVCGAIKVPGRSSRFLESNFKKVRVFRIPPWIFEPYDAVMNDCVNKCGRTSISRNKILARKFRVIEEFELDSIGGKQNYLKYIQIYIFLSVSYS